jgi:hypothetical protein
MVKKKVVFNCNLNSVYFYKKDESVYVDYFLDSVRFKNRIEKFDRIFKLTFVKYLDYCNRAS